MKTVATQFTTIAALAVFVVLVMGLWNMARRESSPSLSQTLMRWRVGLQFVAIVIAMLALYIAR
ncbi:MAG: twin transmembrane helix small protein [Hyphomicrobiaceae bacterium]